MKLYKAGPSEIFFACYLMKTAEDSFNPSGPLERPEGVARVEEFQKVQKPCKKDVQLQAWPIF